MYRIRLCERVRIFRFDQWGGNCYHLWAEPLGQYKELTQVGYLESAYGRRSQDNGCLNVQFKGTATITPSSMFFEHENNRIGYYTSPTNTVVEYRSRYSWAGKPNFLKIHHDYWGEDVYECRNALSELSLDATGRLTQDFIWEFWYEYKDREDAHTVYVTPAGTNVCSSVREEDVDVDFSAIHLPPKMSRELALHWAGLAFNRTTLQPGDLTADCMKDIKTLDINTCTAVPGIINITKDIRSLIEAAEGHVSLKWIINVYLQMLYGTSNTIRDIRDLSAAFIDWAHGAVFGRNKTQRVHSSMSEDIPQYGSSFPQHHVTHTLSLEVETLDNGLADACRKMMDLDVFPELGNIWDIVPYSFVIDWFLPLGDFLEQIDSRTYRSTLNFVRGTYSRKTTASVHPLRGVQAHLQGDATLVVYERVALTEIPEPILTLHSPAEFNQWIPAGALTLQALL